MNAAASHSQTRASGPNGSLLAKDLLRWTPRLTPGRTNLHVHACFQEAPDIDCFPVVEDERPLGLIYRPVFMENFARPFVRDLHGRKSCLAYADRAPLLVEADMPVSYLGQILAESGGQAVRYGYLVVENGRYVGFGAGADLIRTLSELESERHRQVRESIDYASHIQRAFLLESEIEAAAALKESFIWWEPRDKVGGDCFMFRRRGGGLFFGAIDCTGHGVPGAFLTLIVMSMLDHALETLPPDDPAALMAALNRAIKDRLRQDGGHGHGLAAAEPGDCLFLDGEQFGNEPTIRSDDGFDGVLGWYVPGERRLTYASAKGLLLLSDPASGETRVLDGDRAGVGYRSTPANRCWTNHQVELPPGACVYAATDGLIDQIGGAKRIAFGKRRLCELIAGMAGRPLPNQKALLWEKLAEYQAAEPRRDDVTLIGFRSL